MAYFPIAMEETIMWMDNNEVFVLPDVALRNEDLLVY